jgi:hypothetical protein
MLSGITDIPEMLEFGQRIWVHPDHLVVAAVSLWGPAAAQV